MQIVSNNSANFAQKAKCYDGVVPHMNETGLQSTILEKLNFEPLASVHACIHYRQFFGIWL